jgi:hypothetical protein
MSKIEIDEETLNSLIQQAAKNQAERQSIARELGLNPKAVRKASRAAAQASGILSGIIGYGIAGALFVFGLPALIRAAGGAYRAIRAGEATIDPVGLLFWVAAIGFAVAFAAAFIWGFHRSQAMLDEEEMG